MFKSFWQGFLNLVYPPVCILCHDPLAPTITKELLCSGCRRLLLPNRPPFCLKCSRPLQPDGPAHCHICRREKLYFDRAWGTCCYSEATKRLIHKLKYGGKTVLRHFFSDRIIEFVTHYNVALQYFDLVMPVPLHPVRLRERGFNQSLLLAEIISQKYSIPLSINNLRRTRHTQNQARVSQKERWTNIEHAFKIKTSKDINEKNILVVDDLYTTGATLSEIARTLKAAGAHKVCGLTFAIALEPQDTRPLQDTLTATTWTF